MREREREKREEGRSVRERKKRRRERQQTYIPAETQQQQQQQLKPPRLPRLCRLKFLGVLPDSLSLGHCVPSPEIHVTTPLYSSPKPKYTHCRLVKCTPSVALPAPVSRRPSPLLLFPSNHTPPKKPAHNEGKKPKCTKGRCAPVLPPPCSAKNRKIG